MEWAIPIQTFLPKYVCLGSFQANSKQLLPFSYQDGSYTFTSLCILLPTLNVKSYDPATGRLILSLAGNHATQQKLHQFQELLFTNLSRMQRTWFPTEPEKDVREIRAGFQPFLDGTSLHLYCPVLPTQNEIQYYAGGQWTRGAPESMDSVFAVGKPIRLALRMYGVSFHQHPITRVWTGRFRLQHRILAVYAD